MQPTRDARAALTVWDAHLASARGRFRFAAGLPVFRGHFPQQPLLPGVYHLAMMEALAAVALPDAQLSLAQVERAKWSAPAFPERDLEAAISWKVQDGLLVLDGTVHMDGVLCASARLLMRAGRLPG